MSLDKRPARSPPHTPTTHTHTHRAISCVTAAWWQVDASVAVTGRSVLYLFAMVFVFIGGVFIPVSLIVIMRGLGTGVHLCDMHSSAANSWCMQLPVASHRLTIERSQCNG